jgi:hypothetical protein
MKLLLASLTVLLASCANSGSSTGVKPYPKNTCIVSDNTLGSMGTPVTKVHGNQEVKFCCQPCVSKFDKDPQRYLRKI